MCDAITDLDEALQPRFWPMGFLAPCISSVACFILLVSFFFFFINFENLRKGLRAGLAQLLLLWAKASFLVFLRAGHPNQIFRGAGGRVATAQGNKSHVVVGTARTPS